MLTSLRSRDGAAAASALPITRTSAREVTVSAPSHHPGPGPASDRTDPAPGSRAKASRKQPDSVSALQGDVT